MTEPTDATDLRRRIYDAARTPAIRLTHTTLKLAQAGGVFHLNGTEADEITEAVMAAVQPILDERDQLRAELTQRRLREGDITINQARAALGYQPLGPVGDTHATKRPDGLAAALATHASGPCEDCSCCTASGCHQGADSTCPTDRLGHSVCPCTGD